MADRISWRWSLVGALTIIGGYWIGLYVLSAMGLHSPMLPYAEHVFGAACGGAIMTAHAPLRPWREPALAGVLAIGMLGVLWFALPHPQFGWFVARCTHPAGAGLAIAAASGLCAGMVAWVVRRYATTAPTTASIFGLSVLLITGSSIVLSQLVIGLGGARGWGVVAAAAGVFAGGFVTQRMIAVRRPLVCGCGPAFYGFWVIVHDPTTEHVLVGLFAAAVLVLIATLGALIGWGRRVGEVDPPAARIGR